MKKISAVIVLGLNIIFSIWMIWKAYDIILFAIRWTTVYGHQFTPFRFALILPHVLVLILFAFVIRKLFILKAQENFNKVILWGSAGVVGGYLLFIVLKVIMDIFISIAI